MVPGTGIMESQPGFVVSWKGPASRVTAQEVDCSVTKHVADAQEAPMQFADAKELYLTH